MLSRSSSSVDQSGDKEHMRIKSSQILRYAKSLEAAIQDLQMRGCSENEISFENTVQAGYTNANSPTTQACHLFERAGTGLKWKRITSELLSSGESMLITGEVTVFGIGRDAGASGADLLVVIPVSQDLCSEINTSFGISNTIAQITSNINAWPGKYTGSFTAAQELGNGVGKAPDVNAEPTGCIIDANGIYVFYHVLIER